MTDIELITANPDATDEQIVALDAADPSGWLTTGLTLVDLAERMAVAVGDPVASHKTLDGILATIAQSSSPSVQAVASTLASGRAVVIGPAVRAVLQTLLSPDQLAAVIPILRTRAFLTVDGVAAARVADALRQSKDARLAALESYVSAFRAAVNGAASVEALPEVPK